MNVPFSVSETEYLLLAVIFNDDISSKVTFTCCAVVVAFWSYVSVTLVGLSVTLAVNAVVVAKQLIVLLLGLFAPIEFFVPDTVNVVETFDDDDVDINFTQNSVASLSSVIELAYDPPLVFDTWYLLPFPPETTTLCKLVCVNVIFCGDGKAPYWFTESVIVFGVTSNAVACPFTWALTATLIVLLLPNIEFMLGKPVNLIEPLLDPSVFVSEIETVKTADLPIDVLSLKVTFPFLTINPGGIYVILMSSTLTLSIFNVFVSDESPDVIASNEIEFGVLDISAIFEFTVKLKLTVYSLTDNTDPVIADADILNDPDFTPAETASPVYAIVTVPFKDGLLGVTLQSGDTSEIVIFSIRLPLTVNVLPTGASPLVIAFKVWLPGHIKFATNGLISPFKVIVYALGSLLESWSDDFAVGVITNTSLYELPTEVSGCLNLNELVPSPVNTGFFVQVPESFNSTSQCVSVDADTVTASPDIVYGPNSTDEVP